MTEENNNDAIIYPLRNFDYHYNGPMFIRGEGIYLFDDKGKKYIDTISGLWNVPIGYSNDAINKAVITQLSDLHFVNLYSNNSPIVKLYANKLIDILNGDFSRLIYTCSGSESIECAIKIARKYFKLKNKPNKNKIAVLDMSYHGTTYAAMSASGMDTEESQKYAPIVGGFIRIKTPFCSCCESETMTASCKREPLESLNNLFEESSDIAAVIIEPVIGSGGIISIPDWYLSELKSLTDKNECLIIFDEVATGFGRTGSLFNYMSSSVKPDVLCLAKGINNGVIPMGATLINKKIEDLFIHNEQFIEHFSTQNGNPLACSAAYATIQLCDKATMEHVLLVGGYLREQLIKNLSSLGMVRCVRGKGLMVAIDLVDKNRVPISMIQLEDIQASLKKRGLIIYPFIIEEKTSGICLFPSFVISTQEVDKIVSILSKTFAKYCF